MEIKVWDYKGPVGLSDADNGRILKLRGSVSEFRGALQLVATNIRFATSSDGYDVEQLVPVAPIDVPGTFERVMEMISTIDDCDYRAVAERIITDRAETFKKIPAAKSVHHSFISGLLMHTYNMMRAADFFAGMYSDTLNRSLLLAGTVLHDVAKSEEFTFSDLGLVSDYSTKGQLLGHLVMGAQEIARIAAELNIPEEKSVLLQHLVLSHHGQPEFGAAVVPMCAEAEILTLIDGIDSKMEIYKETFEEVPEGEFSARIFALEKKIYHHK